MFHLRELVTLLCLVLLAWTLIAPGAAPDFVSVLPLIAILHFALVAVRLPSGNETGFVALAPSLSSISLRAPPQQ